MIYQLGQASIHFLAQPCIWKMNTKVHELFDDIGGWVSHVKISFIKNFQNQKNLHTQKDNKGESMKTWVFWKLKILKSYIS